MFMSSLAGVLTAGSDDLVHMIRLDQNEKEKRMLELLKDAEEGKSKPKSRNYKIPAESQLLGPTYKELKSIKHAKNNIVNNLSGKHPHKSFEQYLNAELKLNILEADALPRKTLQPPSLLKI